MSALLAAIDRNDIAQYVDSLFTVYIILIFARIVLSWVITFRGSLPYNPMLRAVTVTKVGSIALWVSPVAKGS